VVRVEDPWGKTVARGALNEGSGAILPESIRRYKTPMVTVARAWLPGRYKLVTEYRDETSDAHKTATMSFWYVGALITWVAVVFGLAVAGLAGWWIWRWRKQRRGRNFRRK